MVLIVLGSACQRGSSGPLKVEGGSDGTSTAETARLTRWDVGTTLVNGAGATYPLVAGAWLSERVRARACGCRGKRRAQAGRKVRGVAARKVHRRRSRARHVQLG